MDKKNKNNTKASTNHQSGNKKKYGFWDTVVLGKGTVAEPWLTVEEALQDPDVQKEIEKVERAFEQSQSKNGNK